MSEFGGKAVWEGRCVGNSSSRGIGLAPFQIRILANLLERPLPYNQFWSFIQLNGRLLHNIEFEFAV